MTEERLDYSEQPPKKTTSTKRYDKDGKLVEVDGDPVEPGSPPPVPLADAQSALLGEAPLL